MLAGNNSMPSISKTHLFYLRKIAQPNCRLPHYHRLANVLAEKGLVKLSVADELGDCVVTITDKGVKLLDASSPKPFAKGST